MLIRTRRAFDLKEADLTPEWAFLNRRALMAGAVASGAVGLISRRARAQDAAAPLHAPPNPAYTLDRPVTDEGASSTYNNYYEFDDGKSVFRYVDDFKPRPWTVTVDGMCAKPQTFAVDDLFAKVSFEERLYRHRCVEAWAMAVPWDGFPLKTLLAMVEPLAAAKYVRFETFNMPDMAPNQSSPFYPWPYVEGVTIEEAQNDLAFLVVGVYGKALPTQFGAPLRLALPWKYGFKSIKGIVRVTLTDKRPDTFWAVLGPTEYGFWANVNPAVPHPRWSQARERMLGTNEMRDTQIFNGYGEAVAGLYAGLQGERLYM